MSADDLVFVDTNVLIYAHDATAGHKQDQARKLLEGLWRTGKGCLSVQVLQEFFVALRRKVGAIPPQDARDIVATYARWRVHRPEGADVTSAIDTHLASQISFWDAMIVRSASRLGCGRLYSEDLNPGQRIDGVLVVNPFDASG